MKNCCLLLILTIVINIFLNKTINAQPCILQNSIPLNSGFDYTNNNLIPVGGQDNHWIITNANNIPGAINGSNSVVTIQSGGASNPNSNWISYMHPNAYITNNAQVGFYGITFKYTFRTCQNDSLHFDINLAIDNYISDVRIDGISTGFNQAVSLANSNWQTFSNLLYSNYFLQGIHTIEVDGQNFNVQNALNPHAFNVYGNINSNNNSIVSFSSPTNCTCLVQNIDSIISEFSFAYPNNCDSSAIQFTDLSTTTNSTITNWEWYFGDGNSSNVQNPLHTYTGGGPFQVSLIVKSNTNKKDTFYMSVLSIENTPTVTASTTNSSVCFGSPITLSGSGANTYSWTGGVTNNVSFIPNTTTTYTVTGTDANGCSATSTITISVSGSLPININNSAPLLCLNDVSTLTAFGANFYTWTPSVGLNTSNSATVLANPYSSTTYTVVGTDASGCTGSATTFVDIIQPINISVSKSNDIECGKSSAQLLATGATNYVWTPSALVSNPYSNITTTTINKTTTFYVTGTSGTCTDTDSITVEFYNSDGGNTFIPTAFSPNEDGKNDCLHVKSNANFLEFYFAIYNRWGQRVFESDNINNCWNGIYNGKDAPSETYYYYLKAKTSCGNILKKGDVILIR